MKQLPIILLVASVTIVNALAATVVISKVNTRADAIDAKLLELDSRRNAQYGILKKCVANPQKCEGK